MNNNFRLHKLSSQFFIDFPKMNFPEIEEKVDRPYVVLLVKIGNNAFGLPLRTNLRHSYGYKFVSTTRQTNSSTGIDFTKAVILNNTQYLGKATTIDNKEYIELDSKFFHIKAKFERYVQGYVSYKKKNVIDENLERKYKYSTLQYYHKELGI